MTNNSLKYLVKSLEIQCLNKNYELRHWTKFKPITIEDHNLVKGRILGEKKKNKEHDFINLPFTFDTEATSYYNEDGMKRATMYIWTAMVFEDGVVYYGRTWLEWLNFLAIIKTAYKLGKERLAIIYVHNLPYDGHFMLPWLNVSDMFALGAHQPIQFVHDGCFVFKDSLVLSSKSLKAIGKELKVQKLNDFDYRLKRHSLTPLTDREYEYTMRDVIILYHYIKQEIADNKNDITRIATTLTGIVRRESRAINKVKNSEHMTMYNRCASASPKLMEALKGAFAGGYTHANRLYTDYVVEGVTTFDLSSDYPSQMVKRKFPIGRFCYYTENCKMRNPEKYASLMRVSFKNLRATTFHSIISTSKLLSVISHDAVIDNGRLVSEPDTVEMWITELDYLNIEKFYKWDDMQILEMYESKKGYLSSTFVDHVLRLYGNKTTLKGLEDPESLLLYRISKSMLNSLYGMCVTDPCKSKWLYSYEDNKVEWETAETTIEDLLSDAKQNGFLAYQWGVWVTAYARYDLEQTIYKCIQRHIELFPNDKINDIPIDDVVYCDTDSIKIRYADRYRDIFEEFDEHNKALLIEALDYHQFPHDRACPKNTDGEKCWLGVWDEEEKSFALEFKTLGAKAYMYITREDWSDIKYDKWGDVDVGKSALHITVSGLPKDRITVYIERALANGTSPFDEFYSGHKIPKEKSHKQCVTYVDGGFTEPMKDFNGTELLVTEKAFIHMEEQEFNRSMSPDYAMLVMNTHENARMTRR